MSDLSKTARKAMKEKARRLADSGDPHAKVDGSSWTPPEAMHADVQTGERPISRQARKRGGKVEGGHGVQRADRKPRKGGGRLGVEMVNRNVKAANDEREGVKHDGGYKRGGRTHKGYGGANAGDTVPTSRMAFQGGESRISKAAGLRRGGSVSDVEGTRPKGGRIARSTGGGAHGGRGDHHWIADAVGNKGALHRSLHVPEGQKIPAKKLEKAEHSKNKLVAKRAHLAETLSDLRPGRKHGGRTKSGKTNVNIIIGASPGGNSPSPMPMPPGAASPLPRAVPVPPPMPPAGPPPQMGMPVPMGPPPQGPMPRKRGGRAKYDAGAGSGEGRLEKIDHYGRRA